MATVTHNSEIQMTTLDTIIDNWLAEMQSIIDKYRCSENTAKLIMQSRHGRPSTHTLEFENLLVYLDKRPNPLDMVK